MKEGLYSTGYGAGIVENEGDRGLVQSDGTWFTGNQADRVTTDAGNVRYIKLLLPLGLLK